jgi:hypothetical protein
MRDKVSHALIRWDEGVGHKRGGNDRIKPFGRPERAIEMPAI